MKLLVAEDDLTTRRLLLGVGQKWGYEAIGAEDGERAWEILNEIREPCLMLVDWEMPKLNGPELCRRIRDSFYDDSPFMIMLTARSSLEEVVEGLEAGAHDHIGKPFDAAELRARLQVGKRLMDLQKQLKDTKAALASERHMVENTILTMRERMPFNASHLRFLDTPVDRTSGDLLMAQMRPNGVQHMLLGDFAGHGLSAAIAGPVVSDAFYTMTSKDLALETIIAEMNNRLYEKLPTGLFMAGAAFEVDADRGFLKAWNFSMEDALVFRDSNLISRIQSSDPPLGVLPLHHVEPSAQLEVESGDHVFAFSDGITESFDADGNAFGTDALINSISQMLESNNEIDHIRLEVDTFRGQAPQTDDITLVELSI